MNFILKQKQLTDIFHSEFSERCSDAQNSDENRTQTHGKLNGLAF